MTFVSSLLNYQYDWTDIQTLHNESMQLLKEEISIMNSGVRKTWIQILAQFVLLSNLLKCPISHVSSFLSGVEADINK